MELNIRMRIQESSLGSSAPVGPYISMNSNENSFSRHLLNYIYNEIYI